MFCFTSSSLFFSPFNPFPPLHQAKSDQPDRCGDKAESVHIFNIPEDDDDDNDNNNDDDDGSAAYLLYPSAVVGLVGVMVQTVMWLW